MKEENINKKYVIFDDKELEGLSDKVPKELPKKSQEEENKEWEEFKENSKEFERFFNGL